MSSYKFLDIQNCHFGGFLSFRDVMIAGVKIGNFGEICANLCNLWTIKLEKPVLRHIFQNYHNFTLGMRNKQFITVLFLTKSILKPYFHLISQQNN